MNKQTLLCVELECMSCGYTNKLYGNPSAQGVIQHCPQCKTTKRFIKLISDGSDGNDSHNNPVTV